MTTYKIVRFFNDDDIANEVMQTGLTLEQAQAHCNNPETSVAGKWFDGYQEEHDELEYTAHGMTFRATAGGSNVEIWFEGDTGYPFSTIGVRNYATGESGVNNSTELIEVAEEWWTENKGDVHKYLENHIG